MSRKNHKINPFVANPEFKIPVRRFSKITALVAYENGTNKPIGEIQNKIFTEQQVSTKVYRISEGYKNMIINDLSINALKLFLWIIYSLPPTEDVVYLGRKVLSQKIRTRAFQTKERIKPIVEELCDLAIISPTTEEDYYWINPAVIFSGNRVNKYPNNIQEV